MEFKDYYKVMGVAEDATEADIKKAWRKLAKQFHPDVNKDPGAEAKFKEINEANEVLKDSKKRAAYDQVRAGGWREGQEFQPPPDWTAGEGFSSPGFSGTEEVHDFSDFFRTIFGAGAYGAARTPQAILRRRGEDLHFRMAITLEEACLGGKRNIRLDVPVPGADGLIRREPLSYLVEIPSGVVQGTKIRLRGKGGVGLGGAPNGDLYLEIELEPHTRYAVDGRDTLMTLPLTPWEAALGATIKVPTLRGVVDIDVPPASQAGQKLRLKGKGLGGDPCGDQYLILQILTPEPKTDSAKEYYRKMAQEMPFNPREKWGV